MMLMLMLMLMIILIKRLKTWCQCPCSRSILHLHGKHGSTFLKKESFEQNSTKYMGGPGGYEPEGHLEIFKQTPLLKEFVSKICHTW